MDDRLKLKEENASMRAIIGKAHGEVVSSLEEKDQLVRKLFQGKRDIGSQVVTLRTELEQDREKVAKC